MYKELIISIIIVILIITLDVKTQGYTDMSINDTIESLQELKQNLKIDNIDKEENSRRANEIYQKWMEYHDKLAFFIEHDELEKVETNFVSCKSFIETNQFDFADSELEKIIFILEHISDKYSFNLENIF